MVILKAIFMMVLLFVLIFGGGVVIILLAALGQILVELACLGIKKIILKLSRKDKFKMSVVKMNKKNKRKQKIKL